MLLTFIWKELDTKKKLVATSFEIDNLLSTTFCLILGVSFTMVELR
jgi:hypothetical protein